MAPPSDGAAARLANVIILGLGFMLIFTAFQVRLFFSHLILIVIFEWEEVG